jgi:hypothetical protein
MTEIIIYTQNHNTSVSYEQGNQLMNLLACQYIYI